MNSHNRVPFQQRLPNDTLTQRYVTTGFDLLCKDKRPEATDGWIISCQWDATLRAALPPVVVVNGGIGSSMGLEACPVLTILRCLETLLEEGEESVQESKAAGAPITHRVFVSDLY